MSSAQVGQSITRLIRAAQQDGDSAVGPLLAAYFDRLVQLVVIGMQPGFSRTFGDAVQTTNE
jgi:hypothetical protein